MSLQRDEFLGAIKRAVPALAEMLEPASPEAVKRTLSERSTEELIVQIEAGRFLAEIARLWCISASRLYRWIASDSDRSAEVNLARKHQAALWDWAALQILLHAPNDKTALLRADRIAQHCRWRAVAFSRDDYGHGGKIRRAEDRDARELTTRELEVIARGGELPEPACKS